MWFWSPVPGTASFAYQFNESPATTVEAAASGNAYLKLTPDRAGENLLIVTSRTAGGVVSPEVRKVLFVWPTAH